LGFGIWLLGFAQGCGNPIVQHFPNAPKITSVFPASGAAGVTIEVQVTATFDKNMDASSINTDSFTLTYNTGLNTVTGTVSYSSSGKTVTFTPSAQLSFSKLYTATVSNAVKDSDGNPLENSYGWSFTTAAAP